MTLKVCVISLSLYDSLSLSRSKSNFHLIAQLFYFCGYSACICILDVYTFRSLALSYWQALIKIYIYNTALDLPIGSKMDPICDEKLR